MSGRGRDCLPFARRVVSRGAGCRRIGKGGHGRGPGPQGSVMSRAAVVTACLSPGALSVEALGAGESATAVTAAVWDIWVLGWSRCDWPLWCCGRAALQGVDRADRAAGVRGLAAEVRSGGLGPAVA